MAFADLARLNATYATSAHIGEQIGYRSLPAPAFNLVWAIVDRRPIDAIEGILANAIRARISKASLAIAKRDDEVLCDERIYRVHLVMESSKGFWQVEAVL